MYALRESEVKPEFKAKGIRDAAQKLDILKLSDIERRRYERHIHDARIELSVSQTYYSEGKAEGLAEGKAEGEANIIRNLHRLGFSMEQICQAVGLTQEQVEEIINIQPTALNI